MSGTSESGRWSKRELNRFYERQIRKTERKRWGVGTRGYSYAGQFESV